MEQQVKVYPAQWYIPKTKNRYIIRTATIMISCIGVGGAVALIAVPQASKWTGNLMIDITDLLNMLFNI